MASVEVLAGPERRRRWSIEQKRAIVAAAFEPGAVVRGTTRSPVSLRELTKIGCFPMNPY
jgi:Transposase